MAAEDSMNKPTVPPQQEGTQKDIAHSIESADENDARKLFMIARNRLVNVNEWSDYAEGISATFKLTDGEGKQLNRTAEKGDFFKIDLPATPGTTEGRGHDWVQIEAIEDKSNPNGHHEEIAFRVRPTANPSQPGDNVAHFFSDSATSSFVLERDGNRVTAAVFGRNEVPNTETSNVIDKVRNAVVGTTAIAGFSNIQWKNLVKGFLSTNTD